MIQDITEHCLHHDVFGKRFTTLFGSVLRSMSLPLVLYHRAREWGNRPVNLVLLILAPASIMFRKNVVFAAATKMTEVQ